MPNQVIRHEGIIISSVIFTGTEARTGARSGARTGAGHVDGTVTIIA